nr:MAG TPA: hypothetical protein [Caudoviricetes sp.]
MYICYPVQHYTAILHTNLHTDLHTHEANGTWPTIVFFT